MTEYRDPTIPDGTGYDGPDPDPPYTALRTLSAILGVGGWMLLFAAGCVLVYGLIRFFVVGFEALPVVALGLGLGVQSATLFAASELIPLLIRLEMNTRR